MFNRNTGIVLAIALAAGLGLLLAQKVFGPAGNGGHQAGSIIFYPTPRPLPDFSLSQSDGTRLIPGELKGHWTLVFLGFTFCPDVCPTTLAELKAAWASLGKRGAQDKLRVDFVSVDPERDTPDTLAKYVGFFSPDFLAATGTDAELSKLTRALGIVYSRTKKDDGSIEVDHSGSIVIVDPQGRLVGLFRPPFAAKDLADDMATLAGWH